MTRPGVQAEWPAALAAHLHDCIAADGDRLRDTPCGSVRFQPVTALDISATRIRELLRAGRSARYLLPDAVLETALASGLYPSRS